MGGRYATSKPIAAARVNCASASLNVALRSTETPERGKNSYQAAKRARSRSTTTSSSRSRHVLCRGDSMLDAVGVPGERAAIVAGRPLRGGPDQGDALAERALEVLATL